jgi:hypothetical protein
MMKDMEGRMVDLVEDIGLGISREQLAPKPTEEGEKEDESKDSKQDRTQDREQK